MKAAPFALGVVAGAALTLATLYALSPIEPTVYDDEPEQPEPQATELYATDSSGNELNFQTAIAAVMTDAIRLVEDTHQRIVLLAQNLLEQTPLPEGELELARQADDFAHEMIRGIASGSMTVALDLKNGPVDLSGISIFKDFVGKTGRVASISAEGFKLFTRMADAAIDHAKTTRDVAKLFDKSGI